MTQSVQTTKPAQVQKLSPDITEFLHMLRSLETAPTPTENLIRN